MLLDLGKRCKKVLKCLFTYFTYLSSAKLSSLLCLLPVNIKAVEFSWHKNSWQACLKAVIIPEAVLKSDMQPFPDTHLATS